MFEIYLAGIIAVLINISIHSLVNLIVRRFTDDEHHYNFSKFRRLLYIDLVVLIILSATVIEALVWGYTYYYLGALSNMSDAFYFSLVTYSTLGYGDLVITGEYRFLGAFEATNGVIMLGWSTALVVGFIQKIYFSK